MSPMTTEPRRPDSLIAWILDDEGRTRRLRSVLYLTAPVVVIVVLALTVVVMLSPLAGAAISGLLGVPSVVVIRRWRRTDLN